MSRGFFVPLCFFIICDTLVLQSSVTMPRWVLVWTTCRRWMICLAWLSLWRYLISFFRNRFWAADFILCKSISFKATSSPASPSFYLWVRGWLYKLCCRIPSPANPIDWPWSRRWEWWVNGQFEGNCCWEGGCLFWRSWRGVGLVCGCGRGSEVAWNNIIELFQSKFIWVDWLLH